jgi:hypothetical protein
VQQLKGLLLKDLREKRRSKVITCIELFSPLFMIAILSAAFTLSDVTNIDAATYTKINVQVPGQLAPLLQGLSSTNITAEAAAAAANTSSRGASYDNISGVVSSLKQLQRGPFPVPTFDQFVGLGSLLSANVDFGTREYLVTNNNVGRTFGNLLTLGTLHFAPNSSDAVQSLQSWLETETTSMQQVKRLSHTSEAAAVQYVLDNTAAERTWAVIVIDDASSGSVDYTIRLNYTTVPNTNIILDWLAVGLDTHYERYYLSGFLSLQHTIDQWAYSYTLPPDAAIASSSASSDSCTPPNTIAMPMPTAAFSQNIFFQAVGK